MQFKQKKRLNQLVEAIKKINPEKILLFGSLVQGKVSPNSDIDLCVIKDTNDRLKTQQEIWDLLWNSNFDWQVEPDIKVYPSDVYQDWLKRGDPFIQEIEKGKILYEKK